MKENEKETPNGQSRKIAMAVGGAAVAAGAAAAAATMLNNQDATDDVAEAQPTTAAPTAARQAENTNGEEQAVEAPNVELEADASATVEEVQLNETAEVQINDMPEEESLIEEPETVINEPAAEVETIEPAPIVSEEVADDEDHSSLVDLVTGYQADADDATPITVDAEINAGDEAFDDLPTVEPELEEGLGVDHIDETDTDSLGDVIEEVVVKVGNALGFSEKAEKGDDDYIAPDSDSLGMDDYIPDNEITDLG